MNEISVSLNDAPLYARATNPSERAQKPCFKARRTCSPGKAGRAEDRTDQRDVPDREVVRSWRKLRRKTSYSYSYQTAPTLGDSKRLTDSNDISTPVVQSPQIHHLLAVPRPHRVPQHRRPARSRPRVPMQRMKGGEPIEDDGRGQHSEIRGVADDQVGDGEPSRSTRRSQADVGDRGWDEQEESVKGEIGRLVLAEDLVGELESGSRS